MRSLDEFKKDFIDGKLEKSLFTSTNENGDTIIVEICDDRFIIRTAQDNGWTRVNEYVYDEDGWTSSESYEK